MTPPDDQEPPESSLGRWAVALSLAGLALAASWLLRDPDERARRTDARAPASITGSPASPATTPPTTPVPSPTAPSPGAPLSGEADSRREQEVPPEPIRLDARVEVVHKHAVGRCRGRLFATPAGLRYETENTTDAFTMPFDALETFDFDDANRNLRVKRRKGRTWNFTSATASTDSLRAFTRQVDRARLRLRSGG